MLTLHTLGRLALERDGEPLRAFDSQRLGLAILAILAAEGSMSRDRLMALLWPERDEARARGSLKQALYQLRRTLDTPDLLRGTVVLSLNPEQLDSDVGRFGHAMQQRDFARAAATYTGPFLDGAHLVATSGFEEWVAGVRSALEGQWAEAVEGLAAAAEARHDTRDAAALRQRLHAQDPADVQRTLRLMRALDAEGRRAAALDVAEAHARLLQEEWGLEPDAAVRAEAAALRSAPAPAGVAMAHEPAAPAAAVPPPAPAGHRHASSPLTPVRPLSRARRLLPALGVLAVVIGAAAVWGMRPGPDPALDRSLVAVAPFQVMDTSLALWSEGMAEILTRDLDGAGPLRTVALGHVLDRWDGPADRAGALALGERTGAGVVVFGSALRLGADSVALRAGVLDRGRARVVAEVQVQGPEAAIGRLADSLVVGLLETLGRDHPIGATRRVSLAARSLPAVREFLRGELHFRRGQWDSALVHYDRSIAEDPRFGLAHRRMFQALSWGPLSAARYDSSDVSRRASWALNQGLAPRESLLIRADSLRAAAERLDDPSLKLRLGHEARALLEAALLRYPDDVEAWYELGELWYHDPPPVGGSAASALAAFERAIELDPGFAPAYEHAIELSMLVQGRAVAARYAQAAAAGLTTGPTRSTIGLVAEALAETGEAPRWAPSLAALSGNDLLRVSEHFRWAADSHEVAIRALELLHRDGADRREGGVLVTDSILRSRLLARALAFRGHLREAARTWGAPTQLVRTPKLQARFDPFLELALFGAVPDTVVEPVLGLALDPGTDWGRAAGRAAPVELTGAPWWLARGDSMALLHLAERAGAVAVAGPTLMARFRGSYTQGVAQAYLVLMRGDSTAATERLAAVPDSLCMVNDCFHAKMTLARLLAARGDLRQAIRVVDDWISPFHNTPSAVLAVSERARMAEELGDPAAARSGYRFVAGAWARGDAAPRRVADSALAGLRRVTPGR